MEAVLPTGRWTADAILRITRPDGDFVLEGENGGYTRVVLHIRAAALPARGERATIQLAPESSLTSGFALTSAEVRGTGFNGIATWTTAAEGASGTVSFTDFTDDLVVGSFTFVAFRPTADNYAASRSVLGGNFHFRLR